MRASQHVVKRSLMTCAHISALPLQGFLPLTRAPPYENKKPNETFISLSLTATTINCPYGSTYIFKLQVIFCFLYTISTHLGTEVPVPRGGLGTEVPVPPWGDLGTEVPVPRYTCPPIQSGEDYSVTAFLPVYS